MEEELRSLLLFIIINCGRLKKSKNKLKNSRGGREDRCVDAAETILREFSSKMTQFSGMGYFERNSETKSISSKRHKQQTANPNL